MSLWPVRLATDLMPTHLKAPCICCWNIIPRDTEALTDTRVLPGKCPQGGSVATKAWGLELLAPTPPTLVGLYNIQLSLGGWLGAPRLRCPSLSLPSERRLCILMPAYLWGKLWLMLSQSASSNSAISLLSEVDSFGVGSEH